MSTTAQRIAIIRDFPAQLEQLTAHLTSTQLTTAYNAPEWTIAQNIHHCADAHMNAFIRFKAALTDDTPTIAPMNVNPWAALPDSTINEVASSLAILQGVHQRWVVLLENITDWTRAVYHAGQKRNITLGEMLTTYANHCHAHLQQIRDVMEKMG